MKYGIKLPRPVLQSRHPQAKGLILDLPLFERGGSVVRDLARGNKGTLTNFASLSTAWATKTPIGRAVDFAGDNDFINVPYQTVIGTPNKYISVECWFVPDTLTPGFQYLVDRWTYGAGDFRAWSLDLQTSNVVWRTSNGGTDATSASVSKSITGRTGQLIHAVGTLDSPNNKLRLYVDGVEAANGFGFDGIVASTQQLMIGGGNAGTDGPYDGRIALVRVWNRLLTAREIANLYVDPFALYRAQKIQLGKAPAGTSVSTAANVLSALFSIPAYTITAIRNVSIGAGVLSALFSLPASTVTAIQNVSVSPAVQSATFSTPASSVSISVQVSASALSASFSTPAPTISTVQNVSVLAAAQEATFTVPASTVTAVQNVSISASVQSSIFSLPTPSVTTGQSVSVSVAVQTLTFSLQAPSRIGSFYSDKYISQGSSFSDKYSSRGSSYADKYSNRGTSYSDKHSSRGTSYDDKYSGRSTTYDDKYPPLDL